MTNNISKENRWLIIVNPVAGSCKGLQDWPLISKLLRDNEIGYDAVFTEKKHHATELTVEGVNGGYRHIVVVGGDGTLHEVVHGLFIQKKCEAKEITVAVIAVGTGNDWIRMHGIPRKYSEAIKAILDGKTMLQDVAKVISHESKVAQTRYMANVAGIGFDAVVNRRYNSLKEKGYYSNWLYIFSLAMAILNYRSLKFDVTIETDDNRVVEIKNKRLFTGALGICKYNGGGMLQTPLAIADDGLLDITIIKKISNIKVIYHLKKLFNGKIYDVPGSMFFRAKKVTVDASPLSPLEVDGEPLGNTPITFSVIEKGIKVIVCS